LGLKSYRRILTGTVLSAVFGRHGRVHEGAAGAGGMQAVQRVNVCTWARMSGKTLVAFGATVPVGAIENAPPEVPMAWPPKMDAMVALPQRWTRSRVQEPDIYWNRTDIRRTLPGPTFRFPLQQHLRGGLAKVDCADSTKPSVLPRATSADEAIPGLGTLVGICVPGWGCTPARNRDACHDAVPEDHGRGLITTSRPSSSSR